MANPIPSLDTVYSPDGSLLTRHSIEPNEHCLCCQTGRRTPLRRKADIKDVVQKRLPDLFYRQHVFRLQFVCPSSNSFAMMGEVLLACPRFLVPQKAVLSRHVHGTGMLDCRRYCRAFSDRRVFYSRCVPSRCCHERCTSSVQSVWMEGIWIGELGGSSLSAV